MEGKVCGQTIFPVLDESQLECEIALPTTCITHPTPIQGLPSDSNLRDVINALNEQIIALHRRNRVLEKLIKQTK